MDEQERRLREEGLSDAAESGRAGHEPRALLWGFHPDELVGGAGRFVPRELASAVLGTGPPASGLRAGAVSEPEAGGTYRANVWAAGVGLAVAAALTQAPGLWALDEGGPYVVHARSARAFAAACDHLGVLPAALLYLPTGEDEEPELAAYFDGVVRTDSPEAWAWVRRVVAHPRLYEVEGWAVGLGRNDLAEIERDPTGWDPALLPIPDDIRHLLREATYRDAFVRAVQTRLGLGRLMEGEGPLIGPAEAPPPDDASGPTTSGRPA